MRRWEVTYMGRTYIAYSPDADAASELIRAHLRSELGPAADAVVLVIRPARKLDASKGYVDNVKGGPKR